MKQAKSKHWTEENQCYSRKGGGALRRYYARMNWNGIIPASVIQACRNAEKRPIA